MDARNTILIIDDVIVNRLALRELFVHDYEILEAGNGVEGLALLEEHKDTIAIILLDILMPEMDGYEFLEIMNRRGLLEDIPVIVISGIDGISTETRSLDLGAEELILKPFEPRAVRKRVENVLNAHRYKQYLESLVATQKNRIARANQAILETLSRLIHHRNMESGQHNVRIGKYTSALLHDLAAHCPDFRLSSEDIDLICSATLLHDVGKIVIPDAILNKPGTLTPEEFEIMKTHTQEGCDIISSLADIGRSDFLRYAYQICRYHHERWLGEGYPDGLSGRDIPLWAQAVGVADVYDALVNPRVYKPAIPHEEAVQLIEKGQCGSFSPEVLESFHRLSPVFREIATSCSDEALKVDVDRLVREFAAGIDQNACPAEKNDNRYESLLHCVEATVLEVDLDHNHYMLVHPNSSEIPLPGPQGTFSDLQKQLLEKEVEEGFRQKLRFWLDKAVRMVRRNRPLTGDIECRLWNSVYDRYLWYKVVISSRGPTSRQFLLLFRNINAAMEIRDENRNLIKENELDQMTGVFNKVTIESKIRTVLNARPDGIQHALLVIDVDDFKIVNDSSGHLIGDRVLRATADIIRRHVRSSDLVGRLGGDEFVVLMRDIPNTAIVESKVNSLVSSFSKSMLDCHINGQYITISVGIAISPWNGEDYAGLFECADKALYQAKYCGKAQWKMYDSDAAHYPAPDVTSRQVLLSSSDCGVFADRMWELYLHSERNERGISAFMDAVARHFGLGSLIVQQLRHDRTAIKLFDWRYEQHTADASASRCHCDCQNTRVIFSWNEKHEPSQEETAWCRILARFIGEYRAARRLSQEKALQFKALNMLIEEIPAGIYAVDGRYAVLFRNSAMATITGRDEHAGRCYEQFFGHSDPCPNCPLLRVARFSETVTERMNCSGRTCEFTARALEGSDNDPVYVLSCIEIPS